MLRIHERPPACFPSSDSQHVVMLLGWAITSMSPSTVLFCCLPALTYSSLIAKSNANKADPARCLQLFRSPECIKQESPGAPIEIVLTACMHGKWRRVVNSISEKAVETFAILTAWISLLLLQTRYSFLNVTLAKPVLSAWTPPKSCHKVVVKLFRDNSMSAEGNMALLVFWHCHAEPRKTDCPSS